MNKRDRLLFLLLVLAFCVCSSRSDSASPYRSYNYDFWGEVTAAPEPYVLDKVIDLNAYITDLRDLYVAHDGTIWVADAGKNKILALNQDGEVLDIIESFVSDKGVEKISLPETVYVNHEGIIYISDTGNQRIVVLDKDKTWIRTIMFDPQQIKEMGVFVEGFRFRPRSIAEGIGKKLYVISAGIYDGIMEFTTDGDFLGFIGAPRVTPTLTEIFWYRLATDEQRARRRLFIPVEFSKLDIDDIGFIYTTVANTEEEVEVIKRLNPSGADSLLRSGKFVPIGDINFPLNLDPYSGPSTLVDIVARDNGVYSVLDSKRGRIFTYDSNGNLLYVFGGPGSHQGMFNRPYSIDSCGDLILVGDRGKNTISVFRPTEYAQAIHKAIELYESGDFEESADMWRRVLELDANYEMAYVGIGWNYYLQEDFVSAMAYFRLGEDRNNYSKAYEYYRQEMLKANLNKILTALVIVIFILWLMNRMKLLAKAKAQISAVLEADNRVMRVLRQRGREVLYAWYILFHPFDGFWDLKHEKRGSVTSAIILLVLVLISVVVNTFYTGFIFNLNDFRKVNLFRQMATVLVTFMLWCVVNWGFTTLTDGKGNFRDIFIYSAYALTPIVLILIPITIISNYMVASEGYFYYLFMVVALMWTGCLLFIGTIMIHDYTVSKAVLTIIIIIAGIQLVAFVSLLFFMVIDRLILFVLDLYNEIVYRV